MIDATRTRKLSVINATLLGVALALVTSACGKDNASTPTTPTVPTAPAAPTVTSVAITGLDALRTGFYSDYTATATMSDGTTQVVTASATWASSNANAATVDATGRLTGQTHGSTTLSATYQNRTANKQVNVVNNYGGTWTGTYTPGACDASGAFASAGWCKGVVGNAAALSLVLVQTGNDRSQVAGTLTNAFIRNAPVTGTVTGDGRLILSTDATGTSAGVTFRFQLGGWETRLTVANQMSGRTAVNLSAVGVSGNAYEEHNITTATLTSPQSASRAER